MKQITLDIPDNVDYMGPALAEFFSGMVHKLSINGHKTPPSKCDIVKNMLLMQREIMELHEQWIKDKCDPNLFLELCDIANFAFLTRYSMLLEGVSE